MGEDRRMIAGGSITLPREILLPSATLPYYTPPFLGLILHALGDVHSCMRIETLEFGMVYLFSFFLRLFLLRFIPSISLSVERDFLLTRRALRFFDQFLTGFFI